MFFLYFLSFYFFYVKQFRFPVFCKWFASDFFSQLMFDLRTIGSISKFHSAVLQIAQARFQLVHWRPVWVRWIMSSCRYCCFFCFLFFHFPFPVSFPFFPSVWFNRRFTVEPRGFRGCLEIGSYALSNPVDYANVLVHVYRKRRTSYSSANYKLSDPCKDMYILYIASARKNLFDE